MAEQLLYRSGDVPVVLTCLTTDPEPTGYAYGSKLFKINVADLVGTWYQYTPSGWIRESEGAPSEVAKSFAFGAAELSKTSVLGIAGLMANLQVTVPNWANDVQCTPSLQNASGVTLWTGPALARGASYNIDSGLAQSGYWSNQLIKSTYLLVMTLSNVAGGAGGTVTAIARVVGS